MRSALAALCSLLALSGCDVPVPVAGPSDAAGIPDMSSAKVISGELSGSDGTRATGALQDEAQTVLVASGSVLHTQMDSDDLDPYLTVACEGQTPLTNDDWQGSRSRSYVRFANTTTAAVRCRVLASAYSTDARGAYTVRTLVDEPPAPLAAQPLPVPSQRSGALTAGTSSAPLIASGAARRADLYTVELRRGQTITVRMESSDFDTYLLVRRNAAGIARNDDFEGSRDVSQVQFTASDAGTYEIYAGTFSETGLGRYSLALTDNGRSDASAPAPAPRPAPAARLAEDQTHEGSISDEDAEVRLTASGDLRKADTYSVELQRGQTLTVEMEATQSSLDTYLLLTRDGNSIARNDDAGSTRRSRIETTVSATGTYQIHAGTFTSTGRGPYTLRYSISGG